MTALKTQAINIIESFPEEKIVQAIHALRELSGEGATDSGRDAADAGRFFGSEKKEAAYSRLKKLIRHIPELDDADEKRILSEYREERFGI